MNKMVMGGDGDSDTGSLCGQKEKILVSVRLRPVNEKERARNDVCDWECINNSTIIFKSTIPERAMFPSAYTFDRVFGSECQTRQVYEDGAKEVALAVVNGINASIFAYGQTSSGKTYTMSGVTEYGVADIFDYIEKHPDREYVLKFSAMEIYNEAVRDLLSADCTPLRLLDDPERGTVVERLTEEILTDWNHFLELLAVCQAQRHIGETSLNEMSSRSHQIVRLTIESSSKEFLGPDNPSSLAACVNFVDLAGSERASQTMAAGARLKEGCHINRSLLTLGTVIRKLSKGRNGHVPYRDSKLTRILHNSLGGNARTAIICTMSPARSHVEQSRNTLLFASCAKEVTTNAQVNVVMSDKALVKQLQRELARMERELRSFGSSSTSSDSNALLREKELQIEKMNKEIKELNDQLYLAQSRIQDLQRSTGENGESTKEEYSTLGFPDKSNPIILNSDNAARKIFHRNNSSLDFGENPEDNFLLDGLSPRLSIGTPNSKYIAADPIPGWDNPSPPKVVEDITQDACKEVQCIEVEESLAHDRDEIEKKEDVSSSPERREGELGEIGTEVTYDSLRNKIQEMQKTIDSLVNVYPAVDRSPSSSDADSSSLTSYKISRTRSSKSVLMGVAPYTTPEGSEIGFLGNLDSFRQKNASINENNHRKDSQASFQTDVSDLTDVVSPRKEFVLEQNKMEDVLLKQADEQVSEQKSDEPNQNNAREATTQEKSQVVSEFQLSDWEFEFKMRRAKIVELWDICYVPLVHRSYFFLLFKGDPSDVVYVEVELRRLSFLKTSISGGSHSSVLSIDSIKALNKEREMLSRRIPKKFSRKERENLYSKWNIDLNSKQRSLQLTRMLWMDTKDMVHIKESAKLVGKLVGIFENQMPKEMFGLTFSPQPLVSSRRSFGWSSSMSSLSVVSLS